MNIKKIGIATLVRLSALAIPLLALYLLFSFCYTPHQYCHGNVHRHTGGPVGYVILGFLVLFIWGIALIIDAIWHFAKKEKTVALVNLSLIVLAGMLLVWLTKAD